MDKKKVYSGRIRGVVLISLGLFSLSAGIIVLLMATDFLPALLLMGLPVLLLGFVELLAGMATFATRLEMCHESLRVIAPQWRACPMPPVTRLRVPWTEVRALRHRKEVYHLLPGKSLPFAVDAYAIDTEKGRAVLGGKPMPHLASALREVALRAGLSLQEELPVEGSLFEVFFKGPVGWPPTRTP
jgi:hypothetical protein